MGKINIMKHNVKVITILVTLFFLAQVIGLIITQSYISEDTLPFELEKPELEEQTSFLTIFLFILIATGVGFLVLKMKLFTFWKIWFTLSVFFTLLISFGAFIPEMIAFALAILFALWKVFKPNKYVHNFTELFIYAAIAVIFAPLLTVITVSFLLALISLYDYIAVRKTKHMVTLAKMQSEVKGFAGLLVPYGKDVAILGGGDMGFPLLFAAVVMIQYDLGVLDFRTYIIPICVAFMLTMLFLKGEKKKYYPAMPYLALGCVLGLGIVLLLL
jgi:presenilin-like A22 family membrane protease